MREEDWLTGYEDLPHGAFYSKDCGDYFDVVTVTDLDSATGAEGLVLVESKTTSFTFGSGSKSHNGWSGIVTPKHKYSGVFGALSFVGCEPGWAQDFPTPKTSEERRKQRASLRAQVAEAQVAYGHADPGGDPYSGNSIIVWCERPESAKERNAQRRTWDGWRPEGFKVVREGKHQTRHAEYEGPEGLRAAIESFGPEAERRHDGASLPETKIA